MLKSITQPLPIFSWKRLMPENGWAEWPRPGWLWSSERSSKVQRWGPYGRLQILRGEKGLWRPLGEREWLLQQWSLLLVPGTFPDCRCHGKPAWIRRWARAPGQEQEADWACNRLPRVTHQILCPDDWDPGSPECRCPSEGHVVGLAGTHFRTSPHLTVLAVIDQFCTLPASSKAWMIRNRHTEKEVEEKSDDLFNFLSSSELVSYN